MIRMAENSSGREHSHRRRNALTGEWVLVSPHRLDRPWQGARFEGVKNDDQPGYDADCYLCPGNQRLGGDTNPEYTGVYVFPNDFPAIQPQSAESSTDSHPLFARSTVEGVCRVISFSPDHSRTLSALTPREVTAVVDEWAGQSEELGARFPDGSVQIFENKGEMMGCSQPHPHGQIWAQQSIPTVLAKELDMSRQYETSTGSALLPEYVSLELIRGERIVMSNADFVVVVPYWATWPFETLIIPRRLIPRLPQLTDTERRSFADVIRRLSICYDNLFGVSFPYSAGIHQAPANAEWDEVFSLHMHFYPPLLRSANVRKFMVGYEMLGEPQRDLTPEAAAAVLRDLHDEFAFADGWESLE